jgi:hypothetical protein
VAFFYAAEARDTCERGERLVDGDMPVVGGGLLGRRDAELSFVHADDAAAAFVAAIESGASGLYHVVDDEPVTGAAFFERFADLLDAPDRAGSRRGCPGSLSGRSPRRGPQPDADDQREDWTRTRLGAGVPDLPRGTGRGRRDVALAELRGETPAEAPRTSRAGAARYRLS